MTTIDFTPLWVLTVPILQNLFLVATVGGLLAVAHRLPVVSATLQIVGAPLIEQKFAEAVSYALARLKPETTTLDVHNAVVAASVNWTLTQIPLWLKLCGLTPELIAARIEAQLPGHADYAALIAGQTAISSPTSSSPTSSAAGGKS